MRFTVTFGLNLVKFQNLVKTWWNLVNSPRFFFGENLVKFENLVNSPNFFLVKTWWNLKTWWKPGENLVTLPSFFWGVKTWWNLKTWWKPGELTKFFFGENLVEFQNLVKTWWKPCEMWKPGENLVYSLNFWKITKSKIKGRFAPLKFAKRSVLTIFLVKFIRFGGEFEEKNHQGDNLVKTWWKLGEFTRFG